MKRDQKTKLNAFCCNYVILGNAEEAAVRAGFPRETALSGSIELMKTEECRQLISQLRQLLSDGGSVAAGLKRLAFGSCSDAVYLVFADELPPPDVIGRLDLFNVSEIKRVKGGGVEVKLFDRLKALEKLFELENAFSDRSKAESLIKALSADEECEELDDN
ncbi:MAG: terminase small subunit [Ruminococcus sp.]|uniref:terminase small subunit n=1 Tax=Ruminococcus sp. TaxID=41978 RepID=UPI0025FE2E6E|nr:terminase small subunit [Ruminococcus sp.]MBR5683972.1 terminase small subunit [Ruminococcus sp.]